MGVSFNGKTRFSKNRYLGSIPSAPATKWEVPLVKKKRYLEGDGSMIVSTNSIGEDTPPDA